MTQTMTSAEYRAFIRSGADTPQTRKVPAEKKAPRQVKIRVPEHDEQAAFMEMCRLRRGKYPVLARIYAVPNGGHRHKATAAKMKEEGQRAGVLDVALDVPLGGYHGFKLEMKAVGGTITEDQYREMVASTRAGYLCVVAWGAEEAWRLTEEYLLLGRGA